MSDANVRPLEEISSEVIDSQFKIILSSQCIKAQALLVHKLRKQSEQTKQISTFRSNENIKLENEIALGELETNSLLTALETVKSANVELKKELLLLKEEKNDLTERVDSGIKKYEELWITSKKRYDNIPIIKEKLQIQSKGITVENNINSLCGEIKKIMKALETKKNELINLDKKNIINVAEYMTNERPKLLQYVKEKIEEINNLNKEINELQHEQGDNNKNPLKSSPLKKVNDTTINVSACVVENISNNNNKNDETVLLPKLKLQNIDFDILTDKLKKIKKADYDSPLIKRVDSVSDIQKYNLEYNNMFLSPNLKTSINEDMNKDTHQKINYSEKKLIHILENVQLHKKKTFNIFSNLNPNEFHNVNTIKAEFDLNNTQQSQDKIDCSMEVDQNEVIEEVDLTGKDSTNNIVVSPMQFLDFSQGDLSKSSQKCDEGQMEAIATDIVVPPTQFIDLAQGDLSKNSQKCDEGLMEVIATHIVVPPTQFLDLAQGDLSKNSQKCDEGQMEVIETQIVVPTTQFLDYAQGDLSKSSQKCDEDQMKIIETPQEDYTITKEITSNQVNTSSGNDDSYNEIKKKIFKKHNLELSPEFTYSKNPVVPKKVYSTYVTSKFFEVTDNTKDQAVEDIEDNRQTIDAEDKGLQENKHIEQVQDSSVAGFLFAHGSKGLPELLDVSITSTCIDDSNEFPHCIDSTLLLSPKSDLMLASGDNNAKELSQETPNFLSGFRKVGFFGNSSSEKKSDSNNKNSGFNFNFGSTEKKSRTGLFNMFN